MSSGSGKKNKKRIIIWIAAVCSIFFALDIAAKRKAEIVETFDKETEIASGAGIYRTVVKSCMDKVLSFMGLVLLSPVFLLLCIAVYVDDPGPVFFTQKRVGKDKQLFCLHKFRTMKMKTPHDIPTHQLENPEQYITRVGKVLRKYSLDELPQIWDIFRGRMSIIGPRPALWNQDDLVAERDKYGANNILPGLTGWAQINGRDELEIADKARLDGEYTEILRQGGMKALFFDAKCFLGTVASVLKHDGVVEGGTGASNKGRDDDGNRMQENHTYVGTVDEADAGFEDYGYKKVFHLDKSTHKRVLITGANSYIGDSFASYVKEHYPNLAVDTVDMIDGSWRAYDFAPYDSVFHVAGIAHADVGKVSEEEKARYYAVNTDLAVETCQKAKDAGVRQFVFMSSMIVYGDSAPYGKEKVIDEHTVPAPSNFYGDSKWQADKGVRELQSPDFHVAVLRPPMIYGRGSKGNYPVLAKLAKRLPIFPNVENSRSMLYIDNLCEFVSLLVMSGEGGVYFPQNGEYTKTADMVREIGEAAGKRVKLSKLLNPAVAVGSKISGKIGGLVNKAFGSSVYNQKLSVYEGFSYRNVTMQESIREIEGSITKSILILVNHDVVIYNFRLELVERLLAEGYEVHISSPYGERIDDLVSLGAVYHSISIDRHGMNPVADIAIIKEYSRLIHEVKPFIVLGYTIKPNIYGALAAGKSHIPFVANITGLGTAMEGGGWKQKIVIFLYKMAFTDVQRVFFQNEENMYFFRKWGIALDRHSLLPGSGVNLERYNVSPFLQAGDGINGTPVKFAFISRIMKEKGIDQYLAAAEKIKSRYTAAEFHICGFCEEEYEGRLEELVRSGIVEYHGMIRDVAGFMRDMHCIVHPTYYPEGLSNVLLEACACGRPIITTDRSGCREVIRDGINGYMVAEKSVDELVAALEKFIKLPQEQKEKMGLEGRKRVEEKFDRQIVVTAYIDEIHSAENRCKRS